jgi:hypothetical protein
MPSCSISQLAMVASVPTMCGSAAAGFAALGDQADAEGLFSFMQAAAMSR